METGPIRNFLLLLLHSHSFQKRCVMEMDLMTVEIETKRDLIFKGKKDDLSSCLSSFLACSLSPVDNVSSGCSLSFSSGCAGHCPLRRLAWMWIVPLARDPWRWQLAGNTAGCLADGSCARCRAESAPAPRPGGLHAAPNRLVPPLLPLPFYLMAVALSPVLDSMTNELDSSTWVLDSMAGGPNSVPPMDDLDSATWVFGSMADGLDSAAPVLDLMKDELDSAAR